MRSSLIVPCLSLVAVACADSTATGGSDLAVQPADATLAIPVDFAPSVVADFQVNMVDGGATPVTLTVLAGGVTPEANVSVFFSDASGAQLGSVVLTDAMGRAALVVPAGSQVTAIFGTADAPTLVTITAVRPGDSLIVFDPPIPSMDTVTNASVDSVPPSPPTGTTSYEAVVATSCNQYFSKPPQAFPLRRRCIAGGKFPLLLLPIGNASNELGAFTFIKHNVAGTSASATTSLNPTIAWATTVATPSLSVKSQPFGKGGEVAFIEIADEVPIAQVGRFDDTSNGKPAQSSSFIEHTGFPDAVQGEAAIEDNLGSLIAVSGIATRANTSASLAVFDLTQLLPALSNGTIDDTMPGRPSLSFTGPPSLAGADGEELLIAWSEDLSSGGQRKGSWMVIAPPTATKAPTPQLPTSLAAFGPSSTAKYTPALVSILEGTFISGYDQFRATFSTLPPADALLGADFNQTQLPLLPVNGTLRITALTPNQD